MHAAPDSIAHKGLASSVAAIPRASLEWASLRTTQRRLTPDVQLALLRQAVANRPEDPWLHRQLSAALLDADRKDDALLEARAAAAIEPGDVELSWQLVHGLLSCAEGEEALALLGRLPDDTPARQRELHRAHALELTGQRERALQCYLQFLQTSPRNDQALQRAIRLLLGLDRIGEALELLDALLARDVYTSRLLAERVTVLRLMERHAQASRLEGLDQFLRVIDMKRRGVDKQLNAAVLAELEAHPGRRFENPRQRTRGGWRIDMLDLAGCAALRLLFASIQAAIAQYLRETQAYAAHPFMRLCPQRARISAWALWLSDSAYQEWHIHPYGWLSGVYYVQVPALAPPTAGALVVGTPELADVSQPIPGFCQWHQPSVGDLTLIPAHCYHRTLPTRTATERICIAFDVSADCS